MCLFLTVPWICLQCVIVAFSGHTYFSMYLFSLKYTTKNLPRSLHSLVLKLNIWFLINGDLLLYFYKCMKIQISFRHYILNYERNLTLFTCPKLVNNKL